MFNMTLFNNMVQRLIFLNFKGVVMGEDAFNMIKGIIFLIFKGVVTGEDVCVQCASL